MEKSCKMMTSEHGRANTIMISWQLQLPAMDLNKTPPVNSQSQMKKGPTGPYYSPLNQWPLMDSGIGAVIVFRYVPIDESSRLQSTVPGTSIENNSRI